MTIFDCPLKLTPLFTPPRRLLGCIPWPAARTWVVDETVCYLAADGTRYWIRAGDKTDLASIPRLLWFVLPPDGDYLEAAVLHDDLYRRHRAGSTALTRAQADGLLREAMRRGRVVGWQRWAVYAGVRIGGWWAWGIG